MKLARWASGLVVICGACGGASSPVAVAVDAATRAAAPPSTTPDAGSHHADATVDRATVADAPGADISAATPTWSAIYAQFLVNASYPSNCMGAACHDPGAEKGIDLSTRESGWSSVQNRLTPGMPDGSDLITVLKSGYMPLSRPQMPASDIAQISAWIAAGAQDD